MSVICKIDSKEFKDEKSLHLALRGYGLNKENCMINVFKYKFIVAEPIVSPRLNDDNKKEPPSEVKRA